MVNELPSVLQITFVLSHMVANSVPFKAGEGPQAHVDTGPMAAPGLHRESLYYTNAGLMLRAIIPINRYAEGVFQWDANILSLFDLGGKKLKSDGYLWTSPLRAGLSINATDRVFLHGSASLNGFGGYGLGASADAGVRF